MNSSQNLNLRVVEPPHSVLALIRKLFSKKANRQLFERSWAACVFVCARLYVHPRGRINSRDCVWQTKKVLKGDARTRSAQPFRARRSPRNLKITQKVHKIAKLSTATTPT